MKSLTTNDKLYEVLKPLMNLPEHMIEMSLRMKVDKLPVVTCTFYPSTEKGVVEYAPKVSSYRFQLVDA